MSDTMGMLRIDVEIESHTRPGDRRLLHRVIVDTGAELSWAPASVLESLGITRVKQIRFQQADGTVLERWVGFAILHAAGTNTTDEIVFGAPGDLVLLGARTLEGMNLKVDLVEKRLVAGGPMMAAASPRPSCAAASGAARSPSSTASPPVVLVPPSRSVSSADQSTGP